MPRPLRIALIGHRFMGRAHDYALQHYDLDAANIVLNARKALHSRDAVVA